MDTPNGYTDAPQKEGVMTTLTNADLADWNERRAVTLDALANVVDFKDTAAEYRKQAKMHRATAAALRAN